MGERYRDIPDDFDLRREVWAAPYVLKIAFKRLPTPRGFKAKVAVLVEGLIQIAQDIRDQDGGKMEGCYFTQNVEGIGHLDACIETLFKEVKDTSVRNFLLLCQLVNSNFAGWICDEYENPREYHYLAFAADLAALLRVNVEKAYNSDYLVWEGFFTNTVVDKIIGNLAHDQANKLSTDYMDAE